MCQVNAVAVVADGMLCGNKKPVFKLRILYHYKNCY